MKLWHLEEASKPPAISILKVKKYKDGSQNFMARL